MSEFIWWDDKGYGFYPVKDTKYDIAYFDKYRGYKTTELGQKLNQFRVDLVNQVVGDEAILDIGIGAGHFIELRQGVTLGYDVNPHGVDWLMERDLYCNPYRPYLEYCPWGMNNPEKKIDHMSFWDSLEHIKNPEEIISIVGKMAFLSIPIFEGEKHALKSKHFRPDEHYWYFTRNGLVRWFEEQGFKLVEESDEETKLGREDIGTYVFERAEGKSE